MAELLWRFLGLMFEDGRLLTERMDPSRLIVLLRTLAPRRLKDRQLQNLLDSLESADRLRDDRNFIVHGSWGTIDPDGIGVALSLRAKSEPGEVMSEQFDDARLRLIADRILATKQLIMAISETCGTSPYTE